MGGWGVARASEQCGVTRSRERWRCVGGRLERRSGGQKGQRARGPGCCTNGWLWGLGVLVPFLEGGTEERGDQE